MVGHFWMQINTTGSKITWVVHRDTAFSAHIESCHYSSATTAFRYGRAGNV